MSLSTNHLFHYRASKSAVDLCNVEGKKTLQGETVSFVFNANQLHSRVFLDQEYLEKKKKKKKTQEESVRYFTRSERKNLSKCTFALEIHDVISPLWWFSALHLWETIFKTYLKMIFFSLLSSKATAGGCRWVGGVCVCVCVGVLVCKGGARKKNLTARFFCVCVCFFSPYKLRGKKQKSKHSNKSY